MSRVKVGPFGGAPTALLIVSILSGCGSPEPAPPASGASATAVTTSEPSPSPAAVETPAAVPTTSPTPSPTADPPAETTLTLRAQTRSSTVQVEGTVTADGKPVAGAVIEIQAVPLDGRFQTVQIKGIVPPGARSAHVGVRVNTEGINETGLARINIYRASYTQGGGKNRVPNPRLRVNANHWGLHEDGITVRRSDRGPGLMIRIRDTADMRTIINSGAFRVTPGASYRATMDVWLTPSTAGHAYVTVTWLSSVTEIGRERLDLKPRAFVVPDRRSTGDGRFVARFDDLEAGRYRIVVRSHGDASHLPANLSQDVRVG